MKITVPELSLVVLIGPSGCGKSTFARKHFKPTEILSSDYFRGLVSDDENDQSATKDAFEALHFVAAKRLAAGKLTVIDATNVGPESRKPLIQLAREYHCLPVAVVLNMPEKLCEERNVRRPDRDFGPHVIRRQKQQLRRSLRDLKSEGFRHVFVMDSPEEVEAATIERQRLWNDLKSERGPFDIVGDLHGCFDELRELLIGLGYEFAEDGAYSVRAPEGRKAVFLGDLVDRGPKITETLKLVMSMVESGAALCVPGNHDVKLMRKLRGKNVKITHGLAESLEQLEAEPEEFKTRVADFIDGLVSHYVLDGGALVVAHAGMKETLQGRASNKVRDFALFGETTGETDEYGLPVRYNWAAEYRGKAMVVYGHTPVFEPEWLNRTINVDTGCVFGGKLTALRYPEKEADYVAAYRRYCWPVRGLADLKLAPFHLLATEGAVHADKDHVWHMETLARLCRADEELLLATPYRVVELDDLASVEAGVAWWEELTGRGGEGMVVKPYDFVARSVRGLSQPAVKCRGREYLRIIYGPEYTAPENLERLRSRGLGRKRSLALREFALGLEALERFVEREPLRRVHECVFGVLALESEPVDPRL